MGAQEQDMQGGPALESVGAAHSSLGCVGGALLLGYVALMIAGLAVGFHEPLFFGLQERGEQGIDWFCVPKAFRNLLDGRSALDTWSEPAYGPYSTWFVLHPAVAVWIGAYLAWLPPWSAYAVWATLTLAALFGCGHALARHARSPERRLLVVAAVVASPVSYLLLLYGNVHGVILAAATLLLLGLHELATGSAPSLGISPSIKVGGGLLLSLLCKPVLGLVLPALLVTRATRRVAWASLAAYGALSALFCSCLR